ncbi:MAG: PaaI family thioesterase [Acidimicrobiales bacterium]|nr:PaaI family thioesterase [Acidimicrobiales bacterium]
MTEPDRDTPPFPFMGLLGFTITVDDEGVATASLELGPQHMNPNGVAHGGVAYSLIDTAMGGATMSVVPDGQRCATIEIHVRYHRGARAGTLTAQARVMSSSRRVVHLEATTVDDDGTLIASATGSYAITD